MRVVVLTNRVIVHFHVVVDGLLITQMIIILLLRVTHKVVRSDINLFFLLFLFLLSFTYFDVFHSTVDGGAGVLFSESWLGAGVSEG